MRTGSREHLRLIDISPLRQCLAMVWQSGGDLAKGRTAVVISHRLSTARHADRILFLVNGHITEAGAHDELVERAGVYARLFETQARPYR